MHARMLLLTLALLLSLILPTPLLAQSDLGIDKTPTNESTAEQPLQIIAVSADNDTSALAMLDWLIYTYDTMPNSEGLSMLEKLLFNFEAIPFDTASHKLTPAAKKILNRKALWLKNTNQQLNIVVTGHCDQRGSDTYNKYLGTLRANAVKQFLITCGITHEQMQISSAGDTQPVNKEDNESAWAKNRRVETIEQ